MDYHLAVLLLAATGLVTSALSAVTGFGGAVVLLPVPVALFGVRDTPRPQSSSSRTEVRMLASTSRSTAVRKRCVTLPGE